MAHCAPTPGDFTGRSPQGQIHGSGCHHRQDHVVGRQPSITSEQFELLYADFLKHAEGMTLFAQDLYGGADPSFPDQNPRLHRTRLALAVHPNAADPPELSELKGFVPELTIIDIPSFRAGSKRHGVASENVVAIDFAARSS